MQGIKIVATGRALPQRIVTNEELSKRVDTTDEWIRTRTGIGQRYICENETCTSLAVRAAEKAMEKAGIIKNGSNVIFIDYEDSVSGVFYETSKSCSAVVNSISKNQYSVEKIKHKSIDFSYKSSSSLILPKI